MVRRLVTFPNLVRPIIAIAVVALLGCSRAPWARKPTEEGAPVPAWKLRDFQPKSPRFGQVYGLEELRGSVAVLALYEGNCGTCVVFTQRLGELEHRWQSEGLNVRVAVINAALASSSQKTLVDAASFPLFQDTTEVNAWRQQGGSQNDVYVYGPSGHLGTYFRWGGSVAFDPVTLQGQAALRAAVTRAASTK
jgi:hypothetical protein